MATLTELPMGVGGLAAVDGNSLAVCGGIQRQRFVFTSRSNHVQLRVIPSIEMRFLLRFEGWLTLDSCASTTLAIAEHPQTLSLPTTKSSLERSFQLVELLHSQHIIENAVFVIQG